MKPPGQHPPPSFGYVMSKARKYCKIGPDKYRKGDFFHLPDMEWPEEILKAVDDGMTQLLEQRGMSEDNPLVRLGIEGVYALMETLHFRLERQFLIATTAKGYLDRMDMMHLVTGQGLTIYNLVSMPSESSREPTSEAHLLADIGDSGDHPTWDGFFTALESEASRRLQDTEPSRRTKD